MRPFAPLSPCTVAAILPALLPGFLSAQALTMPPGYESIEAGYYSSYLGAFAEQRIQVLNGDYQGDSKARSWSKLSFRREVGVGYVNSGRSWTKLRLAVGEHDWAQGSATFSNNFVTTPTVVYEAATSWPGTTGLPPKNPASWGEFASKDDLVLPFRAPVLTNGKYGSCFDFTFTGGKLASQAPWTGFVGYYHDGIYDSAVADINYGETALFGRGDCLATGQVSPAYFAAYSRTYGKSAVQHPDRFFLYYRAINLPVNTTCFGVVALAWNNPPVPLMRACEALYLDLSKPYADYLFRTDASGAFDTSATPMLMPYRSSLVGTHIWTQCAYDDGSPKTLQLSMAARAVIRSQPAPAKHRRLYNHGGGATAATGFSYTSRVPVLYLE